MYAPVPPRSAVCPAASKFFLTELVAVGLHTWLKKMEFIPDSKWELKKALLAKVR